MGGTSTSYFISEDRRFSVREDTVALGRYTVRARKRHVLVRSPGSIVYRAADLSSGEVVALRILQDGPRSAEVLRHHVAVFQLLHGPLERPPAALWHEDLASVSLDHFFVRLLAHSVDPGSGLPGPDADGLCCLATEVPQDLLKETLCSHRFEGWPAAPPSVRGLAQIIVRAVAILHARGVVHLNIKPSSFMFFGGRLKLVDVFGCVASGTDLLETRSQAAFSLGYCPPEWARYLVECRKSDRRQSFIVVPQLDVWNVGLTLGELVTHRPLLKPAATALPWPEWVDFVAALDRPPVPSWLADWDGRLSSLLRDRLLVLASGDRAMLARALDHAYFQQPPCPVRRGRGSTALAMSAAEHGGIERLPTVALEVDHSGGAAYGISVDVHEHLDGLEILEVDEEGLVSDWNASHPEAQLEEGDVIVEVGGVTGADAIDRAMDALAVLRLVAVKLAAAGALGISLPEQTPTRALP